MGTQFPLFNFPVGKIYLGVWARRARRAPRARWTRHLADSGNFINCFLSKLPIITEITKGLNFKTSVLFDTVA